MEQEVKQKLYLTVQDFQSVPAEEMSGISPDILPLVSVLMLAYNHAAHIVQAVESILSQQCDFPFELIIGEDCSQDKTRDICIGYHKRYPEIVRVVFSEENVGMHRNFARIWHRARGKYIATCEGDDFWIDPEKLAKQVAWMESRPEFTLCGTYTETIRKDENDKWSKEGMIGPSEVKERYTLEDLIPSYTFHYSSIMVRKESIHFPRWFWDVYCGDRPLYLLCAETGPAGLIPEVTSAYRLHEGGVWSPLDKLQKAQRGIKLFETLDAHFNHRYNKLIRRTLSNILWSYMAEALDSGDRTSARKLFWSSMHYRRPSLKPSLLRIQLVVAMRLYLPTIYRGVERYRRRR